jgi:ParB family chromosome partitioning protein
LSLESIEPDPAQPRSDLGDLDELAASIERYGLLEPLLAAPVPERPGSYILIAGHRRLAACRKVGKKTAPTLVREVDARERLALQLVENLQREDISPLDEARGYKRLSDEFGLSQEQVAGAIGKSVAAVNQTLRLLDLPREILDDFHTCENSRPSKRVLLEIVKAGNLELQKELWERAKAGNLTVLGAQSLRKSVAPDVPSAKTSEPTSGSQAKPRVLSLRLEEGERVRISFSAGIETREKQIAALRAALKKLEDESRF